MPHYNRRADLVCFVNGLPLVFIELKAVYRNIRAGFDDNLTDYMNEHSIAHAFHHNAFLIVSNGDRARYGSITSKWEHFVEWKRNDERDKGELDAEVLLDGMLAKDRLLDIVENFILFDDSRAGRDAQDRGPQPSGAGRQQRGGVGAAAGGTEASSFRRKQRLLYRTAVVASRSASQQQTAADQASDEPEAKRAGIAARRAGASRSRAARRVLAHAGQRQVLLDGVLRRESAPRRCRAISPSC